MRLCVTSPGKWRGRTVPSLLLPSRGGYWRVWYREWRVCRLQTIHLRRSGTGRKKTKFSLRRSTDSVWLNHTPEPRFNPITRAKWVPGNDPVTIEARWGGTAIRHHSESAARTGSLIMTEDGDVWNFM